MRNLRGVRSKLRQWRKKRRNDLLYALALVAVWPRLKRDLDRWITLEGREFLDETFAKGWGIIWITAHLGNWELMACYMATQGYPFRVVAREIDDGRLNRLLLDFRREASVRVILRDSPAAGRQMLEALRRGEVIGMLIDQDTQVKGSWPISSAARQTRLQGRPSWRGAAPSLYWRDSYTVFRTETIGW